MNSMNIVGCMPCQTDSSPVALQFLDSIMPSPQSLVNCASPNGLSTANISQTQADLSWFENGDATQWQIHFGNAGFDTTGVNPDTISENPYTKTGLSENTAYDWYIRV